MAELCAELAPLFQGGTVKSLVPLPPRDLLLVVETPGAAGSAQHLRLRLSASGDLPRLHLQSARQKRPKGPVGPFFRACESELVGARVGTLAAVDSDRIARLGFLPGDAPSEAPIEAPGEASGEAPGDSQAGESRALFLELTGRHANLVLTDGADRVLAALVPPPAGREDPRLVVGQPWQGPGGAPFQGRTPPPLAEYLASSAATPPAPSSESGRKSEAPQPHPQAPLSWLVERVLGAEVDFEAGDRLRRDLARRVERRLTRTRRNLLGLEERAAAADGAERVREAGDLLKSNLGQWKRGAQEVELADYFDPEGGRRAIPLDPKLSPSENVERTFARYRKLVKAQASVHQDLAFASERVAELERLLERVRAEDSDPEALEAEALAAGLLPQPQAAPSAKAKPQPKPRVPYRTFTACAGGEIRVGRSARDNDELTLRHSKGSDLWLHTADAPGSHVVLCVQKGGEPDPEEVLDAAHLAIHFSPLKGARKADVHVAPKKLVHKPKGAKAGLVTLSGGKVLAVRLQPERLARLLGSDRHPPGPPDSG